MVFRKLVVKSLFFVASFNLIILAFHASAQQDTRRILVKYINGSINLNGKPQKKEIIFGSFSLPTLQKQ